MSRISDLWHWDTFCFMWEDVACCYVLGINSMYGWLAVRAATKWRTPGDSSWPTRKQES